MAMIPGPDNEVWFGLNDLASEGQYRWVSSGLLVSYVNWGPDEPSATDGDGEQEDCGTFSDVLNWDWNDRNCASTGYWICEY